MTLNRILRQVFPVACLCMTVVTLGCESTRTTVSTTARTETPDAPPLVRTSSPEPMVSMAPCMEPVIRIDTSLGAFSLTLDAKAAPLTVDNFVNYVDSGFYRDLVFHRVVPGMMIQGGAYTDSLDRRTEGLRDPVFNEWDNGLKNKRLTVGMVRRPGVIDSSQNEFYVNLIDHVALDMGPDGAGYCVFGAVTDGFDTIDRIAKAPVAAHPKYAEGRSAVVPTPPIRILAMTAVVPLNRESAKAEAARQKDIRENRVAHFVKKMEKEAGRAAVKTESGLIYIDMIVGNGGVPVANSNVEVYYRGYYLNEVEFESQMDTVALLQIPGLNKGMREGLLSMSEGGTRVVIIPPHLGYGSGGIPGKVAPDATLIFDLRLVQIK